MPFPEEASNPDVGIKLVENNDEVIFAEKPCFVLGPGQYPFTPNPNVTCKEDGTRMIPPIPELSFKGIDYSAIHYRADLYTTPVMSAFQIFTIDSRTKVPEQIEFLTNSRELYISMDIAIRSLGNQLPQASYHLRTCRSIVKVLDFQIARLQGRVAKIEDALNQVLKYCANCSVKERFDIIIRAAISGIVVERFLDELDKIRCLTKEQCDKEQKIAEEKKKEQDKKKEQA
ncbi:hypothetical protein PCANC_13317 [Puccinia coronata f. sp. avenae]|uniref:DUF7143 domain-containing protein n=1 Tax=Puccinia coronata f. sp. avenae TaxID=200324 RepID=A0A2N5SZI6_9BASI|nr:hypothetical protein PCANC_13317 [Puccinia coronata f. sp. avenae]PLW48193.1 hypothetical protein PCASD_03335 [Puccinia coronata f. sp. avenae]